VAGHFAQLTRNARHIAGYIHKQALDLSTKELEKLLEPAVANWNQTRESLLKTQLEKAAEAGKLVCGLEEVRKAAKCSNSRLVVIERDASGDVDQIVEKVLENGGDIEKADSETLAKYGPIALIRYY
jgi:hypothetical protein